MQMRELKSFKIHTHPSFSVSHLIRVCELKLASANLFILSYLSYLIQVRELKYQKMVSDNEILNRASYIYVKSITPLIKVGDFLSNLVKTNCRLNIESANFLKKYLGDDIYAIC